MNKSLYLLTDARYLQIARAQALFLAKQWQCDVHLFVEDDSLSFVEAIDHPNTYIHLNVLNTQLPSNVPTSKKWPKIVFLRNYVPQFLNQYDRLLYLDLDILSADADHSIWSVPLENGVGAVSDAANLFSAPLDTGLERDDWLERIGVKSGKYFNSGVLLIEPTKWETKRLEDALNGYFDNRTFNAVKSQDFLNFALDGMWTELSPRWNFQPPFFEQDLEQRVNPIMLHFCNRIKPWFFPKQPGATNLRREHEIAFKQMLESALIDPDEVSEPSEFRLMAHLRKRVRSFMYAAGLPSSKENRAYMAWLKRRAMYLEYLDEKIKENAFSDLGVSIDLGVDKTPSVRFDGRNIFVGT